MSSERRDVDEMVAEAAREIAVLLVVFLPLERMVNGLALTGPWFAGIVIGCGGLFCVAVVMERRRSP